MTICYSFASRSRPAAFFETLDSILSMSVSDNYFVAAKLDNDDPQIDEYRRDLPAFPEVTVYPGLSNSKIHAINRDVPKEGWDIICNLSDDMRFITPSFDNIIREHMEQDCFLHFPDSFKGEKLCTMSIMDRAYYERFGYVYHPAYNSLFADDEAQSVAKILGRYKFVDIPIFDHLHYSNGKAKKDALYKRNDTYKADRAIFQERQKINFGL